MDYTSQFSVTKNDDATVTIAGELPFAEVEAHRGAALKKLGAHVKIDGFREGHVPEKILIERVGEGALLAEMAERAIAEAYPQIVHAHRLDVIGYPEIRITKVAPGNPLGFTATVAILPEITLPDVQKIAHDINKEKASADVTEEELETQIKDILRQKAAYERLQHKAAQTHTHADGTVHEGPAHDDEGNPLEPEAEQELELPELTDEVVKTLGQPGQFESIADFKAKLREHMEIEKKRTTDAAHRAKITDKIIEGSSFVLPQIMIDSELNQMFAQMEEDLTRANLKMDDYLAHIKKTREDLKKEWAPAAEKRARLQLVLNEIAKRENIKPEPEAIDQEVTHLIEHYKDADENRVRVYVSSVLTNEAVMKMLESQ